MWWTGRLGPSGLVGVGMQAPSMGQAGSDSGHTGLAGGVSVGDEEKGSRVFSLSPSWGVVSLSDTEGIKHSSGETRGSKFVFQACL